MKTKEFNLTNKIYQAGAYMVVEVKEIKEFIKEVKDILRSYEAREIISQVVREHLESEIDKKAGDKLL